MNQPIILFLSEDRIWRQRCLLHVPTDAPYRPVWHPQWDAHRPMPTVNVFKNEEVKGEKTFKTLREAAWQVMPAGKGCIACSYYQNQPKKQSGESDE